MRELIIMIKNGYRIGIETCNLDVIQRDTAGNAVECRNWPELRTLGTSEIKFSGQIVSLEGIQIIKRKITKKQGRKAKRATE